MDDELGFLYISKHFEPHTRTGRPRVLIVDGHSSHVCWPVIQFALDHDIHIIQLPSKSTHILQPLDVGCFALLQANYERHLREWFAGDPLGLMCKAVFLELLFKARIDTYKQSTVTKAWISAHCWPVDLEYARGLGLKPKMESDVSKEASALDTPVLLRKLAGEAEEAFFGEGKGKGKAVDVPTKRTLFHLVMDTAIAKVTTYRDIIPRATTLTKLRNGKVHRKKVGSRHIGSSRVFTRTELNAGLKRLEEVDKQKREAEQGIATRKRALEERKVQKLALETQWKLDLEEYAIKEGAWRVECTAIEAQWREQRDQARLAHKRPPKKPTLPPKPKRPLKPKGGLTIVEEDLQDTIQQDSEVGEVGEKVDTDSEDEEVVRQLLRDLELDRFAEIV